ncbi:MAG: hypothetical protein ABI520_02575 [Caldimonas sp.]
MFAEVAASIADDAADIAEPIADEAPASGTVTTVVVEGAGAIVAGGVTVVVVSSFLLQAANEMAAARVTINNAVFMFLLDFKFGQLPAIVGTLWIEEPHRLQDMERTSISSA